MKKRTFEEFITLSKKRYILLALWLIIISISGIIALICILFQLNILTNYDSFVNKFLQIILLIFSIFIWKYLIKFINLFSEGELDWVFGENIPKK